MSFLDLKDAVVNMDKGITQTEGYRNLANILEDIQEYGIDKYKYDLVEDLEQNNRCRFCCGNLVDTEIGCDIDEFWGRPEYDVDYVPICEDCGRYS